MRPGYLPPVRHRLVTALLSLALAACTDAPAPATSPPAAPVPDPTLAAALSYHGPLDSVAEVRFRKTTTRYDADGAIAEVTDARYVLLPTDGAPAGAEAPAPADGPPPDTLSPTRGGPAAFFAATLPWRLRDAGAVLAAVPAPSVPPGLPREAVALDVTYPTEADADAFRHYFDAATGRHLAYAIDHPGPDDALVVNEADTLYRGLRLPTARTSYRLRGDSVAYVIAAYRYTYY